MPAKKHSRAKTSSRIDRHRQKPPKGIEYDTWIYAPRKNSNTPIFYRYRKVGNKIHRDEVMFHPGHTEGKASRIHQLPHMQLNISIPRQITISDVERGTRSNKEVVRKMKPFLKGVDKLASSTQRYTKH